MSASKSRPERWRAAQEILGAALDKATEALEELSSLQEEYQEWMDNLPDSLQEGALYDRLDAVTNLEIQSGVEHVEELQELANEIDSLSDELPLGFGRD